VTLSHVGGDRRRVEVDELTSTDADGQSR